MQISNELKKLIAEATKLRTVEQERWAAVDIAEKAHESAQTALRAHYLKLQEEGRRGYSGNSFPPRRLLLIDGKVYMLDLAGSVQGEVLRDLELEQ